MDALFALALLLISILLIMLFLNRQAPYQAFGLDAAGDAMNAMRTLKLEDLRGNPRYPYANIVLEANLTSEYNASLIESVMDLYYSGNDGEAEMLAEEILGPAVPSHYGLELLAENPGLDCDGQASDYSCIYSESREAKKNFVSVDRHFVYYNNRVMEARLVLYK